MFNHFYLFRGQAQRLSVRDNLLRGTTPAQPHLQMLVNGARNCLLQHIK